LLEEYSALLFAGLLFGLFPGWWRWTSTILNALIRQRKDVPQWTINSMWPNPYKIRGVGYSFLSTYTNLFKFGQYVFGAVILFAMYLVGRVDLKKGNINGEIFFLIIYFLIWLLPAYLLKRYLKNVKSSDLEWVNMGRP
jgi:hypothetical protein